MAQPLGAIYITKYGAEFRRKRMNKFSSLIAATLLLSSSLAGAETTDKDDLRYCLDLPSDKEIAKCAGEISAGAKGQAYTRERVEKILAEEKTDVAKSQAEPAKSAKPGVLTVPSGNP